MFLWKTNCVCNDNTHAPHIPMGVFPLLFLISTCTLFSNFYPFMRHLFPRSKIKWIHKKGNNQVNQVRSLTKRTPSGRAIKNNEKIVNLLFYIDVNKTGREPLLNILSPILKRLLITFSITGITSIMGCAKKLRYCLEKLDKKLHHSSIIQ